MITNLKLLKAINKEENLNRKLFNNNMRLKIFFILLPSIMLFVCLQSLFCQAAKNTGFKFFKNYSPQEYNNSPQNWGILQDKQGIIYAANQGGLLEFDGISWRTIEIPYKTVRSIDIDETGTIYIGGKNELGFLTPDKKGNLEYVSLTSHLNPDQKKFADVLKTNATEKGIFFNTGNILLHWNSKQFDIWLPEPKHSFTNSFTCGDSFFLHQDKIGIMQISDGRLELIPGGETFAADSIYMISPYDIKKILIGTRSRGFFLHDGIKAITFPTEADEYLKKKTTLSWNKADCFTR